MINISLSILKFNFRSKIMFRNWQFQNFLNQTSKIISEIFDSRRNLRTPNQTQQYIRIEFHGEYSRAILRMLQVIVYDLSAHQFTSHQMLTVKESSWRQDHILDQSRKIYATTFFFFSFFIIGHLSHEILQS